MYDPSSVAIQGVSLWEYSRILIAIYNAIDIIKERQESQYELGTGGLFLARPLEYNTTDLGYTGTQSTEIISCEFGHF